MSRAQSKRCNFWASKQSNRWLFRFMFSHASTIGDVRISPLILSGGIVWRRRPQQEKSLNSNRATSRCPKLLSPAAFCTMWENCFWRQVCRRPFAKRLAWQRSVKSPFGRLNGKSLESPTQMWELTYSDYGGCLLQLWNRSLGTIAPVSYTHLTLPTSD